MLFSDQPWDQMHLAQEYFLLGEFRATACQLRNVVEWMYLAAGSATYDTAIGLRRSAEELDRLAIDSDGDAVRTVGSLESAFTQAELVLAADHFMIVQSAFLKRHHAVAGFFLRSAATHIERARSWSGLESNNSKAAAVVAVRNISETLIEGRGFSRKQVVKSMKWVHAEIEYFECLNGPSE